MKQMADILALDVGDKRVGVALGMLNPKSSAPFAIFQRAKGLAEEKIIELIVSRNIKEVVAGLPLSEDGTSNEQCIKIERFCLRILRRCKVRMVFVDEYASSFEANERIATLKKFSYVQRKKKVDLDAVSASIILESYLEHNSQVVIKRMESDLFSGKDK